AAACQVFQFFLRGLTDLLHGGVDAPAVGGDLLVGAALHALLELVLARAGEEQVGVAVDEAGQDRLAGGVDEANVGRDGRQLIGWADPGDATARDDHGPVGDAGDVAQGEATKRTLSPVGDADQLGGIVDDERHGVSGGNSSG